MEQTADNRNEVFVSASTRAFAFLVERWGFQHCGIREDGMEDPRDRHTTSRYRSDSVVVEVSLTHLAAGLFVIAWRTPESAVSVDCWDLHPNSVVDLDSHLKGRLGEGISPIFPDLDRPLYLSDLFNSQPRKYVRTVVPRLGEAIEAMARRLEEYGRALLTGDPKVFDVPQPAR